ncbi:MAG: MtrB/PioB family outer membrane beta-barrel protein [Pseudomonadota bacterium]
MLQLAGRVGLGVDVADLTGRVDLDSRKRSTLTIRQASWRLKNDETSYRLELRRSMSATVKGAVAVVRAKRDGSDYLVANNAAAADLIDPVHFADRDRDKTRLSLDWTPPETLSFQAMFEDSDDTYDGRALGPQAGEARFYSLDAAYTLADDWQLNLWASREETGIDQATVSGTNGTVVAAQTRQARLRNIGDGIGGGITGRLNEKLEVGAELQYEKDRNDCQLVATVPATAVLPDIDTCHSRLRLFLQYALREQMGVRIDYVDDRFDTNDWTWTGWVYADGSSVLLPSDETGRFIGVSAYFNPR